MPDVQLPGLRAENPMAFLAALGVQELLGRRLGWSEAAAGWCAVVDHSNPVEGLLAARPDRSHWPDLRDLSKLTLEQWLQLAEREPRWASALGCQHKDSIARTQFDLGKAGILENLRKLPARIGVDHLTEALFGPWQYRDDNYSCGLDPTKVSVAARSHRLPSEIKKGRSVLAALWLALESLPAFPVYWTERGPETTGWQGDVFVWPIWTGLLHPPEVRCLLSSPVARSDVSILFESERVRTAKTIQVLSHSRRRFASGPAVAETRGPLADRK